MAAPLTRQQIVSALGGGAESKPALDLASLLPAPSNTVAPPPKPSTDIEFLGPLGDFIDMVDTPRAMIASTIKEFGDLAQGRGFSPRDWWKQTGDNIFMQDVMRDLGVDMSGPKGFFLGLGLDIAIDPITHTLGPLGAAARAGMSAPKLIHALGAGAKYYDDIARGVTTVAGVSTSTATRKSALLQEAATAVGKTNAMSSAGREALKEVGLLGEMGLSVPGTGRLGRALRLDRGLDALSGGHVTAARASQAARLPYIDELARPVSEKALRDAQAAVARFGPGAVEDAAAAAPRIEGIMRDLAAGVDVGEDILGDYLVAAARMAGRMPVEAVTLPKMFGNFLYVTMPAFGAAKHSVMTQPGIEAIDTAFNSKKSIREGLRSGDYEMVLNANNTLIKNNRGWRMRNRFMAEMSPDAIQLRRSARDLGLSPEMVDDMWRTDRYLIEPLTGKRLLDADGNYIPNRKFDEMFSVPIGSHGEQAIEAFWLAGRDWMQKALKMANELGGGSPWLVEFVDDLWVMRMAIKGRYAPTSARKLRPGQRYRGVLLQSQREHAKRWTVDEQVAEILKQQLGEDATELFDRDIWKAMNKYMNMIGEEVRRQAVMNGLAEEGVLFKNPTAWAKGEVRDLSKKLRVAYGEREKVFDEVFKAIEGGLPPDRVKAVRMAAAQADGATAAEMQMAAVAGEADLLEGRLIEVHRKLKELVSGVRGRRKDVAKFMEPLVQEAATLGYRRIQLDQTVRALEMVRTQQGGSAVGDEILEGLHETLEEIRRHLAVAMEEATSVAAYDRSVAAAQAMTDVLTGELGLLDLDSLPKELRRWASGVADLRAAMEEVPYDMFDPLSFDKLPRWMGGVQDDYEAVYGAYRNAVKRYGKESEALRPGVAKRVAYGSSRAPGDRMAWIVEVDGGPPLGPSGGSGVGRDPGGVSVVRRSRGEISVQDEAAGLWSDGTRYSVGDFVERVPVKGRRKIILSGTGATKGRPRPAKELYEGARFREAAGFAAERDVDVAVVFSETYGVLDPYQIVDPHGSLRSELGESPSVQYLRDLITVETVEGGPLAEVSSRHLSRELKEKFVALVGEGGVPEEVFVYGSRRQQQVVSEIIDSLKEGGLWNDAIDVVYSKDMGFKGWSETVPMVDDLFAEEGVPSVLRLKDAKEHQLVDQAGATLTLEESTRGYDDGLGVLYLRDLEVPEMVRGQQRGSRMMEYAIRYADKMEDPFRPTGIYLHAGSRDLVPFYEGFGFRVVPEGSTGSTILGPDQPLMVRPTAGGKPVGLFSMGAGGERASEVVALDAGSLFGRKKRLLRGRSGAAADFIWHVLSGSSSFKGSTAQAARRAGRRGLFGRSLVDGAFEFKPRSMQDFDDASTVLDAAARLAADPPREMVDLGPSGRRWLNRSRGAFFDHKSKQWRGNPGISDDLDALRAHLSELRKSVTSSSKKNKLVDEGPITWAPAKQGKQRGSAVGVDGDMGVWSIERGDDEMFVISFQGVPQGRSTTYADARGRAQEFQRRWGPIAEGRQRPEPWELSGGAVGAEEVPVEPFDVALRPVSAAPNNLEEAVQRVDDLGERYAEEVSSRGYVDSEGGIADNLPFDLMELRREMEWLDGEIVRLRGEDVVGRALEAFSPKEPNWFSGTPWSLSRLQAGLAPKTPNASGSEREVLMEVAAGAVKRGRTSPEIVVKEQGLSMRKATQIVNQLEEMAILQKSPNGDWSVALFDGNWFPVEAPKFDNVVDADPDWIRRVQAARREYETARRDRLDAARNIRNATSPSGSFGPKMSAANAAEDRAWAKLEAIQSEKTPKAAATDRGRGKVPKGMTQGAAFKRSDELSKELAEGLAAAGRVSDDGRVDMRNLPPGLQSLLDEMDALEDFINASGGNVVPLGPKGAAGGGGGVIEVDLAAAEKMFGGGGATVTPLRGEPFDVSLPPPSPKRPPTYVPPGARRIVVETPFGDFVFERLGRARKKLTVTKSPAGVVKGPSNLRVGAGKEVRNVEAALKLAEDWAEDVNTARRVPLVAMQNTGADPAVRTAIARIAGATEVLGFRGFEGQVWEAGSPMTQAEYEVLHQSAALYELAEADVLYDLAGRALKDGMEDDAEIFAMLGRRRQISSELELMSETSYPQDVVTEFQKALRAFNNRRTRDGYQSAMTEAYAAQWGPNSEIRRWNEGWSTPGDPEQQAAMWHMLNSLFNVQNRFGEFAGFFKWYDQFLNYWKAQAVSTPGFVLRNGFGGSWMSYAFGGMELGATNKFAGTYFRAIKRGGEAGVLDGLDLLIYDLASSPKKTLKVGFGSTVDINELRQIKRVLESGIVGGGQVITEVERAIATRLVKETRMPTTGNPVDIVFNPFSTEFAPFRAVRSANEQMETVLRGSLAFDVLQKGGSLDEAAGAVYKLQFNYGDLTPTERKARRVIPFWTWQKNVVPVLVESLGKHPRAWGRLQQFKGNMESSSEQEGVVPDYFLENMGIRLPWKINNFQTYWIPDLPFRDLNRLVKEPTSITRVFAESAAPPVRLPLEIWAKKQFFADLPFSGRYQQVPPVYARVPFLMEALSSAGKATKNSDGTWKMRDHDIYQMDGWMPFMARFRRLLPNESRYSRRVASTTVSVVFGTQVRVVDPRETRNQVIRDDKAFDEKIRDLVDVELRLR